VRASEPLQPVEVVACGHFSAIRIKYINVPAERFPCAAVRTLYRPHMPLHRSLWFAGAALAFVIVVVSAAITHAQAIDPVVLEQLTPTGKLRVGVAAGSTPGTGNVAIDPAGGRPRGIGAELGAALAQKLKVEVEWVTYPNSGDLTDAGATGAWDVAFMPVDEARKQKLDFGAAHIVLQSTWMVGPGSPIQTLADVDKPGTRIVGVENTASSRAAQRYLKNVSVGLVKSTDEGFELLRTGQVDVTGGSRESLVVLSRLLPGARVLDGGYLNSYVAVAVPKGRPAASAYASAFVEEAKASGLVRRILDSFAMQTAVIPAAGTRP
jgi:polar amino acid transport system substrate-binding protein